MKSATNPKRPSAGRSKSSSADRRANGDPARSSASLVEVWPLLSPLVPAKARESGDPVNRCGDVGALLLDSACAGTSGTRVWRFCSPVAHADLDEQSCGADERSFILTPPVTRLRTDWQATGVRNGPGVLADRRFTWTTSRAKSSSRLLWLLSGQS